MRQNHKIIDKNAHLHPITLKQANALIDFHMRCRDRLSKYKAAGQRLVRKSIESEYRVEK